MIWLLTTDRCTVSEDSHDIWIQLNTKAPFGSNLCISSLHDRFDPESEPLAREGIHDVDAVLSLQLVYLPWLGG